MQVTLSQMELRIAKGVAQAKMNQNQRNGVTSRGLRDLTIDMRGVCGELAVCKKYNAYPDFVIGPHYSGYDLSINDIKIDVKTTKYNPGYLQAKLKKNVKDCDAFILVHDASPIFTLLGWAKSEELISDTNIKDTGYGPNYNIDSSSLTSMDFFEPYIEWKQDAKSV